MPNDTPHHLWACLGGGYLVLPEFNEFKLKNI